MLYVLQSMDVNGILTPRVLSMITTAPPPVEPCHFRLNWGYSRAGPSGCRIYYIFFITIMAIPPEKLQKPFIISSTLFGGT